MFKLKSLLALTALLLMVGVTVAGAAPAPQDSSSQNVPVMKTFLRADLTLKTVFSAVQPQTNSGSLFGRTCRCSCGFPCKTNADCGPGGVCAAGITCCDAPNKKGLNSFFAAQEALSSHKNGAPVTTTVNCK